MDFLETEFDVVAESFDGKHILIGECKWQSADYGERLLNELRSKAATAPFVGDREVHYVLFLREPPLDAPDCTVVLPDEVIGKY